MDSINIDNSYETRLNRIIASYNEAIKVYVTANERLKDYTPESDAEIFLTCKNLYSKTFGICDPLLRIFIVTKGVPCPRYNKEKTNIEQWVRLTKQDDSNKFTAFNFCAAIAHYNADAKNNGTDLLLKDINLQCFYKEKTPRNEGEHLAKLIFSDTYELILSLREVILDLNSKADLALPPIPKHIFDFDDYNIKMSSFDSSQRRFVLILTEPLHRCSHDDISRLMQIHWSVIIDFDGTSDLGGFKSICDENQINLIQYAISDFERQGSLPSLSSHPFYINLFEGIWEKGISAGDTKVRADSTRWENLFCRFCGTNYPNTTLFVMGNLNSRTASIYEKASDIFPTIDLVCLSSASTESTVQLPIPPTPSEDDYSGQNSYTYSIMCNQLQFFDSLEKHDHLLPKADNRPDLQEGYRFPIPKTGKTLKITDTNFISTVEESLEMLHIELLENGIMKYNSNVKSNFLRGGIPEWENIFNNDAALLIDEQKLEKFQDGIVFAIENRTAVKTHYLFHNPGFGGSTLGKIIAWNLHKKVPVFWLRSSFDVNSIVAFLNSLYIHLNNLSYLVIVDEGDFTGAEVAQIEQAIESKIDIPVYCLFIQRKNKNYELLKSRKKSDSELLTLFTYEKTAYSKLKIKCSELLNDEEKLTARWDRMEKNLTPNDKCPLLINLYLLEEDFTLEKYVSKFLNKIPEGVDGVEVKTVLKYISFCDYFGNLGFSAPLINKIFKHKRDGDNLARQRLHDYDDLILDKKGNDNSLYYRTRHYRIAEEMLSQLLNDDIGSGWIPYLKDLCTSFIDFLVEVCSTTGVDDVIEEFINCLFTDGTATRELQYANVNGNDDRRLDYTRLINTLPNSNDRIEIIYELADKFGGYIEEKYDKNDKNKGTYNILAHIYAQCARIGSGEGEEYSVILDYCRKAKDIMYYIGLHEYDLEHMLGMCHLNRADSLDCNDRKELDEEINLAIEHFDRASAFGSPSYGIPTKLRAATIFIKKICEWDNIEKNRYEKLSSIPESKKILSAAFEAIQQANEYDLSTRGKVDAIRYRDEFYHICFPSSAQNSVQELNNLLSRLDSGDKSGQFLVRSGIVHNYQRKYYNPDTQRQELLIKAYKGNNKAIEDAKQVFDHLNTMVFGGYEVSSAIYKMWFNYAKFKDVAFKTALDVATSWKDTARKSGDDDGLVWGSYYQYIITLMNYTLNNVGERVLVESRYRDLSEMTVKRVSRTRESRIIRDWFSGNATGMGVFMSSNVIDIANVPSSSALKTVEGHIVEVKDREGYLLINSLTRLSGIGRPSIGSSINKNMCVFFKPNDAGIVPGTVGSVKTLKFRFGFSFERMEASNKSIVDFNIPRVELEKNKDSTSRSYSATATEKKKEGKAVDDKSKKAPISNQKSGYMPETHKTISQENLLLFTPTRNTSKGLIGTFVKDGSELIGIITKLSNNEKRLCLLNERKLKVIIAKTPSNHEDPYILKKI